jgi:hypothetical protein
MVKSVLKFLFLGVLWLFIFSIPLNGKSVFFPLQAILVKNQVVEAVGKQTVEAFFHMKTYAQSLFQDGGGKNTDLI